MITDFTTDMDSSLNETDTEADSSYISVGFFLAGVISARFGLWLADLAINQVMQEEVKKEDMGKINGVQSGLNSAMTTLKFVLVRNV